ncbi:MAG: SDR family oxidoreductase [Myxococcota bacterium]
MTASQDMPNSTSKRVVVVGASSGLGRCIAIHRGQQGDRVALLARRTSEIEEASQEAGSGAVAIQCDVTDESGVAKAISEAAERLGGIDAIVYATGMGSLCKIEETSADLWRRAFDTNVLGASLITAAALPHLEASGGVAAYLSSVSGSHTAPWPGLANYAVTKAALERLIEAWRQEHPHIAFTTVVVGDCAGGEGDAQTQFSSSWDQDLVRQMAPTWIQKGLMAGALLEIKELLAAMDMVIDCGASANLPKLAVTPRPPKRA